MKTLLLLLTAVAMVAIVPPAHAQNTAQKIPTPSCDRINYTKPQDYLILNASFGDAAKIRKIAAPLKADTPEKTLVAIGKWINENLKYDGGAAYAWRNFDTALDSKVYGGCADHALVFAALARANGIPTVFVKTMDADWIREFRTTGTCQSWRGHVFLEVYMGERWRLLDASMMQIYDDYEPTMRLLPGNRYAYDKGADPYALLLSLDWERWKKQTSACFSKFNLALLPMGEGRAVGGFRKTATASYISNSAEDIYVVANSPVYQAVGERCNSIGGTVRVSFNTDFDRLLGQAKGCNLIITCVGNDIVLPEVYHERYMPITAEELKERVKTEGQGVVFKKNQEGTKVFLIYGKDLPAIMDAIKRFALSPKL